jgi:uncharacterized membrane protein
MADEARSSIVIDANKTQIMSVIADFESYPAWAGFIKSAQVLESGPDGRPSRVRFHLDAGVLKDDYVLAYEWEDDDRVSWHLVQGRALKSQDGSYQLVAADGATDVTYQLSVELNIPMLGMFKRKAERVIMDTALKELKKRVEG